MSSLSIAHLPSPLQGIIFDYCPADDLQKVQQVDGFHEIVDQTLDTRVAAYISQWQEAQNNSERRLEILRNLFIRESSDFANFPKAKQDVLFKVINLTNDEINTILKEMIPRRIPELRDHPHYYVLYCPEQKSHIELFRVFVWKRLFNDRKEISINLLALRLFDHDVVYLQWMNQTLIRAAKICEITFLQIENGYGSKLSQENLKTEIQAVHFKEMYLCPPQVIGACVIGVGILSSLVSLFILKLDRIETLSVFISSIVLTISLCVYREWKHQRKHKIQNQTPQNLYRVF